MTRTMVLAGSWLALVACNPTASSTSAPADALAATSSAQRWSASLTGDLVPRAATMMGVPGGAESALLVAATSDSQGTVHRLSDGGEIIDADWLEGLIAPTALGADANALWIAEADRLHRVDPRTRARETVQLPAQTDARALAVGYAGTIFVADAAMNRIHRVSEGKVEMLAESPELGQPRALVLSGAQLLVGGQAHLRSVDLATGRIETIATEVGVFEGIALDHEGYYVVAIAGRGLLRITPDGTTTELAPGPVGTLAFDSASRTLYVVDANARRVVALDYLALAEQDPAMWAARDARPMKPFEIDGIALSGAEYWPYRGDKEPDYPGDVLWGFYPEKGVVFEGDRSPEAATPEAIACAERSFEELRAWVRTAPPEFRKAIELGASSRFYLWVNDYSRASKPWPHDVRPNRFWYWERKPAVAGRVPGYWKWETTLTSDGECLVPQPTQIDAYLAEKVSNSH